MKTYISLIIVSMTVSACSSDYVEVTASDLNQVVIGWSTVNTVTLVEDAVISGSSFDIPSGKTLIIAPGKKIQTESNTIFEAGTYKGGVSPTKAVELTKEGNIAVHGDSTFDATLRIGNGNTITVADGKTLTITKANNQKYGAGIWTASGDVTISDSITGGTLEKN
ncbi:MAG: hypothetical protein LBQ77_06185 [Treponema sp.]|jgi:hypothetical protein|nr:hypothetical protein [Treponema sp.]